MPDDKRPGADAPEAENTPQPRPRRTSTKRPKKQAAEKEPATESKPTEDQTPPGNNHENGNPEGKGDTEKSPKKRANRRHRGKGKPSKEQGENDAEDSKDNSGKKSRDDSENKRQRRRLDPEKVANKAWKIFLAEVSEEGVALIGDNDARELSRRCFRLAELFMEEQERRG